MKAVRVISILLSVFIVMPIWYWLLYQLLVRVHASELMWFLYWVYAPAGLFTNMLSRLIESASKD
jgi:hypothetical protein